MRLWTAHLITQSFPVLCSRFLSSLFHSVLRKGQVVTGYYRWLQRRGGYLWIQSTATVSINHKAPHERNVIWVNYVLRSAQTLFYFATLLANAKLVLLTSSATQHQESQWSISHNSLVYTHTPFSPDASLNTPYTHTQSNHLCTDETKARGVDWITVLIGLKLYNYIKWMSEFWCWMVF